MDNRDNPTPDIGKLYDKYADMLYRVAYSSLMSKECAEDAVQDVFAKFIRAPRSFKDSEHEKAWFLRVTVNCCHDLQRKRAIRIYTPLEEITDLADTSPQSGEILNTVLKLPEKYKTVIILHYFEGLRVDEIAQVLRISKSAVKMRLARGRDRLKDELEQE